MRILMTSENYIFQTGGVSNVILALERGLRALGHEVKTLAVSCDGRSFREGDAYFIGSFPVPWYPEQRRSLIRRHPLLEELAAWKPDLIHAHTEASTAAMARALARKTGAPLVMTCHTDYAYFLFGRGRNLPPLPQLAALWGRFAYGRAARVIAPSQKACGFPQLRGVSERVTVVPNGVDLSRYRKPCSPAERASLLSRYGLEDNGHTLVMVTRVSREKNVGEILRFFPALLREDPPAQLLIAGDGPDRARLERLCEKTGLSARVRFAGRIDPDEVWRCYAAGDVFVSASEFEVHSMAYLEAMACGLPLVCRADESLRGVLENGGNGYIYRTEAEFVTGVRRILTEAPLRAAMRENGLRRMGEFSCGRFTERTLALYESVLKEERESFPCAMP